MNHSLLSPLRRFLLTGLFMIFLTPTLAQRATVLSPQEPRTLLPHFDLLTLAHEVQHLVFDCLFVVDENGTYAPQLASRVPTLENGGISEDGRSYTITLREGVQWHDGEPFTAQDVVFTHQVITDPDLPVPNRTVWEDIESVEALDDHTVQVTFPSTNVSFLDAAATTSCFILPRHLLEGEDIVDSPLNRQPVGTGPFVFEQWESGSFIEVSRNDNYWREETPHLESIVVRITPGTEGQRAALQRGEADLLLHMSSADLDFVADLDAYEVVQGPAHAWWQFWINNDDPILSDLNVRRALAHALEKEAITETVLGDIVDPQHAMFPSSHWAHNPDVRVYAFDPEQAQQLLEDAGWTVGSGGIREKDGEPLRLEILNIAGQAERRQVIQIAQSYWRAVGIDATIREIDAASFPPTMSQGDFQLAYGFFSERQEPVFNLWLGTNWQRYENDDAFELLRQVPGTVDPDERAELIQAFQRIVAEDAAMLPLAPRPLLNAAHEGLQGYTPSLTGSLWNAEEWQK